MTVTVMCDFATAQGQERSGLLFEERLERAERRRLLGNQLFGQGLYKEALTKYAVVSRVACELICVMKGFSF